MRLTIDSSSLQQRVGAKSFTTYTTEFVQHPKPLLVVAVGVFGSCLEITEIAPHPSRDECHKKKCIGLNAKNGGNESTGDTVSLGSGIGMQPGAITTYAGDSMRRLYFHSGWERDWYCQLDSEHYAPPEAKD